MNRDELYELAQQREIPGRSEMDKDELRRPAPLLSRDPALHT
jgi:hypothetical protein